MVLDSILFEFQEIKCACQAPCRLLRNGVGLKQTKGEPLFTKSGLVQHILRIFLVCLKINILKVGSNVSSIVALGFVFKAF